MIHYNEDKGNANQKAKQARHVVLVHPQKVALVQNFHLDIAKAMRSETVHSGLYLASEEN